jgi:hypothetical protein
MTAAQHRTQVTLAKPCIQPQPVHLVTIAMEE